jgi:hypothetical protein
MVTHSSLDFNTAYVDIEHGSAQGGEARRGGEAG